MDKRHLDIVEGDAADFVEVKPRIVDAGIQSGPPNRLRPLGEDRAEASRCLGRNAIGEPKGLAADGRTQREGSDERGDRGIEEVQDDSVRLHLGRDEVATMHLCGGNRGGADEEQRVVSTEDEELIQRLPAGLARKG